MFVQGSDNNIFYLLQPSVRKTHCSGRKHKENVKDYYQKWMEEQAQSLIDKTSKTNDLINCTVSWNSSLPASGVLASASNMLKQALAIQGLNLVCKEITSSPQ